MKDQLMADLKQAMLDRDELKKTTLQGIKSAIKYAEIDAGHDFDEAETMKLLQKEAKKRKESIELYKKGGNEESAAKEQAELEIIESYLPEAASEEDIKAAVEAAVSKTGASGMADMGKVIGSVKSKLGEGADAGTVARFAKELLG